MKKCPICKCTVDEDSVCPYCNASLTYEEEMHTDSEKLVFNKYTVLYYVKQTAFSIISIGVCACLLATNDKAPYASLYGIVVLLCLISLLFAIFSRFYARVWAKKYKRDYAEASASVRKYLFGIAAMLLSLIIKVI